MHEILVVIDILSAVGIIGLVLLQQGKGADMGAAFGSGASSTLFGARGSANFLTRTTAVLAIVFFASNLGLAYLAGKSVAPKSITETVQEAPKPAAPAVPEQQTPKAPEVPK
ncbi:MAG: preprotein translocase subunit SecG [Betaproteobacteria bacterium SG8_41]|jgi:preprotein translocase subunit SecG|nr:MAG: preprotein translocase subunit SecG [Betaproteobacteria bacterium SG8_41]KPK67368.1 MAG: preprotein translocase subunit SecG [Acidithiobacillales bacterium SM23_46]